MKQNILLENILNLSKKSGAKKKRQKRQGTLDRINALYEGWGLILNAFRSGIFSMEEKQGKRLRILHPKKLLQRIPIALPQVKAGNTFKNLKSDKSYIL